MKRNYGLDLLKAVCAFLVICIHSPFPGMAGATVTPLTRIAVPLFFMITGYYYSRTKERGRETKQIKKILLLLLFSNLLYLLWDVWKLFLRRESIAAYFGKVFSGTSLVKFALFNISPFSIHLWYLGAILYTLLIVFLFEKKWDRRRLYPLIPVLLLADIVFGKYSLLIFGRSLPYYYVRNFLCVGLPYFLLGDLLYRREIKAAPGTSLVLMLVFACTSLAERFLLGHFQLNGERDHYISTTFYAVFAFLLAVHYETKSSRGWLKPLYRIGSELSKDIYILHPIFIVAMHTIIKFISRYIPLENIYAYAAPFIIFALSAIAAWILRAVTRKIKQT